MEVVGPGHTSIPSVLNDGVELAFDIERYSDDVVVPAATEDARVAFPANKTRGRRRSEYGISRRKRSTCTSRGAATQGLRRPSGMQNTAKPRGGTNAAASGWRTAKSSARRPEQG